MKIVAVTPAGRKKYLEVLAPYIFRDRKIFDQWIIWVNTHRTEDINFCKYLKLLAPDFVTLVEHERKIERPQPQPPFFKTVIDPDTIYIKFDDDICWIARNAVSEIVKFRKENPEYFVIMANTICNGFCAAIHQRNGSMTFEIDGEVIRIDRHYDNKLYRNPRLAEYVHKTFLKDRLENNLAKYEFPEYPLSGYPNFSINCISWNGSDFAKFGGIMKTDDEERWICTVKPPELKKLNCVCGTGLVSHFGFYTHRKPNCEVEIDHRILSAYKLLAQRDAGIEECKLIWGREYLPEVSDEMIFDSMKSKMIF